MKEYIVVQYNSFSSHISQCCDSLEDAKQFAEIKAHNETGSWKYAVYEKVSRQ